jgi:hypothetical protein
MDGFRVYRLPSGGFDDFFAVDEQVQNFVILGGSHSSSDINNIPFIEKDVPARQSFQKLEDAEKVLKDVFVFCGSHDIVVPSIQLHMIQPFQDFQIFVVGSQNLHHFGYRIETDIQFGEIHHGGNHPFALNLYNILYHIFAQGSIGAQNGDKKALQL